MKYTANYNLKKPEGTDVINIDDLNDNADIIDSELKKLNTNKVDKVAGKGLSTNDFTTTEKNKLAGIEEGAQKNKVYSVNGKTGAVSLSATDVGAETPAGAQAKVDALAGEGNVKTVKQLDDDLAAHKTENASILQQGHVRLVDGLTSTNTNMALTARQGKILNDKIESLNDKIQIAYGSVVISERYQQIVTGFLPIFIAVTVLDEDKEKIQQHISYYPQDQGGGSYIYEYGNVTHSLASEREHSSDILGIVARRDSFTVSNALSGYTIAYFAIGGTI